MAPLKGELGAKRSEGFSQKGTSSCVKHIPISRLDKGGTPGYNEDKRGHCYFSGQATKIPAHFMRREVVQMWKKALQVLLLAAILLLALSTKAC